MADYINPTAVPTNNKKYSDFDIPQFQTAFPYEQVMKRNEDLVSSYDQAIQGQEKYPALQQRYENRYMIPELREAMQTGREAYQNVLNEINAIPETTKATTRDSMVTEGQAAGINQAKYEKLRPVAESLGQTVEQVGQLLTEAEANLNTAVAAEIAQQKKELEPFLWEYDLSNILSSMEMTGWSQANSNELTRLITNMQAGVQISEAEKNRAHELAMQEASFQNQLKYLQAQSDAQIRVSGETGATRLNNINALNSLWGSL